MFKKRTKHGAGTEQVAKAALSNTLGGIGYFFGASEVRLANQGDRIARSWPAALFTAVPSRSFFPRGFIWDEGFHQVRSFIIFFAFPLLIICQACICPPYQEAPNDLL